MSTYKEQDIENLLAHLREGVAPDSVSALVDDVQIECDGAKEGESVWMHLVLPGARYGKDDMVTYDPYETARAYAAGCDFEIDAADADIARCIASGGYRGGAKVAAVYVPVGDLPRETTVFPDMDRALASIGLDRPETETLAEYGGVTVKLLRAGDEEGSALKPNRTLCRDGETEIIRGGFLVVATGRDGGLVDLPGWAIESAKERFADPSSGPFRATAELAREVRRTLGEQIERAGRTPSDIAALVSQLAAKPGGDGGPDGKHI